VQLKVHLLKLRTKATFGSKKEALPFQMKITLTILIGIFHLSSLMAQQYETQQYDLIKKIEEAELRYYPPVMKIKSSRVDGFRALFGYISGDNAANEKIAMTTPVYMGEDSTGNEVMEFVLPRAMKKEYTPAAGSEKVEVYESPSGYFIAYSFGGYALDWVVRKATNTLRTLSEKNEIKIKGTPLLLVYNSPYKFLNRKNEILFEVEAETLKMD